MREPQTSTFQTMAPLSDDELAELDAFLVSDATSDETLMLDSLDGYLTAIAIGPTSLLPSAWLSDAWGPHEDDAPAFATQDEAQRIIGLIVRHFNSIVSGLENNPDGFEPFLRSLVYFGDPREYLVGEPWALGFMQGVALCRQDWQPLFDDAHARQWLEPLHLLGADDTTDDELALIRRPDQREDLTKKFPASIAGIYRYWLPYRQAVHERLLATTIRRAEPKVGRNDPCPCGSGKKFKKCCGSAETLH
jgi:uncharacterized protein